ncbi:MAG: fibronectin type III domain-containing protein [Bacteroidota bacterium]
MLEKIERNENVANQIPLHLQLTDPPHSKTEYLVVTADTKKYYTLHLTGDHEATKKMHEKAKILDSFYYDTAEYTEVVANATNDATLLISMGFEPYATPKPRTKKGLTIRDGNHPGELIVEYPKLKGAAAYRAEVALIVEDAEPIYFHAGACSITFMVITRLKPGTRYLMRLNGIFPTGEGPASDPVSCRTKD